MMEIQTGWVRFWTSFAFQTRKYFIKPLTPLNSPRTETVNIIGLVVPIMLTLSLQLNFPVSVRQVAFLSMVTVA